MELVGLVLPLVIDLINKRVDNSKIRFIISLVISIIVAIIINYDSITSGEVLASGALIFTQAQIVYKTFYEKSNIRTKLLKKKL